MAWNVPLANGSPVTGYYLEVGADSGHVTSHVIRMGASETQHTIADLKPNTTYRLVIVGYRESAIFLNYVLADNLIAMPPVLFIFVQSIIIFHS